MMTKSLLGCAMLVCVLSYNTVFALNDFKSSVFQIVSYRHDKQDQVFVPEQYGSSISIVGGNIITNAHVILDEKQEPLSDFELCGVVDSTGRPKCFASATLLYYDPDIDLAMLKVNTPYTAPSAQFALHDAPVGAVTFVKGYPGYGLGTVTTTRGVLAGEYGDYQKIDADLDQGNSGGAAFDEQYKLIGVPTFTVHGEDNLGYIIPLSKIRSFIAKDGIIMYPETKTNHTQFQSYLKQRHRQLNSRIINDPHFGLVIPTDFYLKNIIQTQDRDISQYQLMSKNQNVSVSISTTSSIGHIVSEFEQLQEKTIEDYKEYFDDVTYTQTQYKGYTQEQLIAKGTDSDKFQASASTTIQKDSHHLIEVGVNGKTFDKNFQKGVDLITLMKIIPSQKPSLGDGVLIFHGLQIPVMPGIELSKSIDSYGVDKNIRVIYQGDASIYSQKISPKKLNTVEIDEELIDGTKFFVSDEDKPYFKTKLIKNKNGVLMVVSEFIDYDEKETKITFATSLVSPDDGETYVVGARRYLDHENTKDIAQDVSTLYNLLDAITLNTQHAGTFSKTAISLADFRAIKLADAEISEDDLEIGTGVLMTGVSL